MKVDCHEVAVRINEVIQRYEVNFEIVLQSRAGEGGDQVCRSSV